MLTTTTTTMTTSHTGCDERAACDCLCHHHCPKRRYPEHVCGAASCRPCGCQHRRQAAGPPSSNPGLGRLGGSAPSLSPRDQTSARYVIFGGSSKAGNWNLARGSLGLFAPGLVCDWRMALRRLVVSCHSRGVKREKDARISRSTTSHHAPWEPRHAHFPTLPLSCCVRSYQQAILQSSLSTIVSTYMYLYLSIDLPQSGTKTIIGISGPIKKVLARETRNRPP